MSSLGRLTLALAVSVLVACSGGDSKPAGGAGKPIVLGFSQIGAESEWRTANTTSVQSAAKDAGIDLRFSDAQQKQENIRALRLFVAQKVDVIAFSPWSKPDGRACCAKRRPQIW
jgi:simple sugar transport system substrate-binding protein